MGCFVSVQVATNGAQSTTFKKSSSKHVVPSGVILPTTVGLECMLKQSHLREIMRQFCDDSWNKLSTLLPEAVPTMSGFEKCENMSAEMCCTSTQSKTVAINCIDFWADVEDLKRIPTSRFKFYRIAAIVQEYVMYGATKKVPLSRSTQESLMQTVFGSDLEASYSASLFGDAIIETLDFLISEVYFACKQMSFGDIAKDHTMNILKTITTGLKPMSASAKSAKDCLTQMIAIRDDSEYLALFKKFVQINGGQNLLAAYLDAVELREYLVCIESSDNSSLHDDCFRLLVCVSVNDYYQKYLSLGARFRVLLPEAVLGDFLGKLARKAVSFDVQALCVLEDSFLFSLSTLHTVPFLRSKEYLALFHQRHADELGGDIISGAQRSGPWPFGKRVSFQTGISDRGACNATMCTQPSSPKQEGEPRPRRRSSNQQIRFQARNLQELKSLLRSGFDSTFSRFLTVYGDVNAMHFYQSVMRLEYSVSQNPVELKVECEQIYHRYISKTAPEMIHLPESFRRQILQDLVQAPRLMFSGAAVWVLKDICDMHWMEFKSEVLARAGCDPTLANDVDCPGIYVVPSLSRKLSFSLGPEDKTDDSDENEDDVASAVGAGSAGAEDMVAVGDRVLSAKEFGAMAAAAFDGCVNDERPPFHLKNKDLSGASDFRLAHDGGCVAERSFFSHGSGTSSSATNNGPGRLEMRRGAILPGELETAAILASLNFSPRKTSSDAHEQLPKMDEEMLRMNKFKCEVSSTFHIKFRDVLDDMSLCAIFKKFLDEENTPHTLTFLVENEVLVCIMDPGALQACALRIFYKYIHANACCPLPISQAVRQHITESIFSMNAASQLAVIFRDAVEEVLHYIEFRQFRIFQNSSYIEDVYALLTERKRMNCHDGLCSRNPSRVSESPPVPTPTSPQRNRFSFKSPISEPSLLDARGSSNLSPNKSEPNSGVFHSSDPRQSQQRRLSQEAGFVSPGAVRPARRGAVTDDTIEISTLNNLSSLLCFQTTLVFFMNFCKSTYCQENVMFWLDAEAFSALPVSIFMRRHALRLYLKYIEPKSEYAVNIAGAIVSQIEEELASPHPEMFKRAQTEVFKIMEMDCLPKFLASRYHAELEARINTLKQPSGHEDQRGLLNHFSDFLRRTGDRFHQVRGNGATVSPARGNGSGGRGRQPQHHNRVGGLGVGVGRTVIPTWQWSPLRLRQRQLSPNKTAANAEEKEKQQGQLKAKSSSYSWVTSPKASGKA